MVSQFHTENQRKIMIQCQVKSLKSHFMPFFGPNLPKKTILEKFTYTIPNCLLLSLFVQKKKKKNQKKTNDPILKNKILLFLTKCTYIKTFRITLLYLNKKCL